MGVASLVLGLWNWLYLKNEQMELTDFLQAGTNLDKLKGDWKFLGGNSKKWVRLIWSQDSKIDYIWRMNR